MKVTPLYKKNPFQYLCFGTLKYPRELIFERNFSLVPVHFFERKIKKNTIMKDKFYLKYLFDNTSKMVYSIKPSENRLL